MGALGPGAKEEDMTRLHTGKCDFILFLYSKEGLYLRLRYKVSLYISRLACGSPASSVD